MLGGWMLVCVGKDSKIMSATQAAVVPQVPFGYWSVGFLCFSIQTEDKGLISPEGTTLNC